MPDVSNTSRRTLFVGDQTILLLGPVLAVVVYLVSMASDLDAPIAATLAITSWVALWWVFEPIPIPATSILPFLLFPFADVLTHKQAAAGLGSHVILLLMGGFMLAKGVERSGLHERFAFALLRSTGQRSGRMLVFAFMLAGASLSMWISNTAACLVLLPVALAVIKQVDDPDLPVPLVLGVAFSCNLGGIATLVGTPPNLVFAGVYENFSGSEYSFLQWLKIGLPITLLGLPIVALWLTRRVRQGEVIQLPAKSQWRSDEQRVLGVFGLVVLLWIFRLEPFGGWSAWLGFKDVGDSTIALLGVALMFVIPAGATSLRSASDRDARESSRGPDRLLDWQTAASIPWGMLLLFAGGITVAKAFQVSGTAQLLGEAMQGFTALPPFLIIFMICIVITFLTELTSNVATTTLFMPVLAAAATVADLPIELMMVPAAISASCAFMLPVATAPNAIAFGTGHVTVRTMMREGFVLNIMMACVITLVCSVLLV